MPGDTSACRFIFGESDGFPGLTVDRFSDVLVTQTLSAGIEKRKDTIFPILLETLKEDGQEIRGIYERNDVAIRALEGLEEGKGWFCGGGETVTEIEENGIKYLVDFENGQKTGFFLDQKYNRLAVAKIARGKKVLDCFTHTGSFALNAALGGAQRVTAVDISRSAIDMAIANAERNGLKDRMDFLAADIFDLLPSLIQKGGKPYDLIILDPPAFTKSRRTADRAEKGYKEINLRALQREGLQGDKPPRPAAAPERRISGHGLLQPLHALGALRQHAQERRPRRRSRAQTDRGAPAGPGPPDTLERPRDGLSQILYIPGGLRPRLR